MCKAVIMHPKSLLAAEAIPLTSDIWYDKDKLSWFIDSYLSYSVAVNRPDVCGGVFAYGFEDLTGAEWALLEALAARSQVTVSIPYEPGRAAFQALTQTVTDLTDLAQGRIEELARPSRTSVNR